MSFIESFSKPVASLEEQVRVSLRARMDFHIHRYLMSNADGRWNGAEKAERHVILTQIFIQTRLGIEDYEDVNLGIHEEFEIVHRGTQPLTSHLDEVIGFELEGRPSYETLVPKFFDKFIELADKSLNEYLENK